MKIGLTGATGFVGCHFIREAEAAGHEVTGYSRKAQGRFQRLAEADFSGMDAMVHLAGENVFGLWTRRKKSRIRESRIDGTRQLVDSLAKLESPPSIFICASGASAYGDRGDEKLDECASRGDGFLAEVVRDWEAEAERAAFARVALLRLGMVLGADAGAGRILRRAFRWGLGGRLGSGDQWMPWIHVRDAARAILHAVENPVEGPVNVVAPEAVTNATLTKTLAAEVRRPAFAHVPKFVLRLLPGGMDGFFLDSVRAMPGVLQQSHFHFQFPTLAAALHDICS